MAITPLQDVPAQITAALRKASRATGADFEYLLKTAERESSFKSNAKSAKSTAAGLFQFIEDTWFGLIKKAGSQLGLGNYAEHIVQARNGAYHVANRGMRQEILELRDDPDIAALVAGEFSRENAQYLTNTLGREPTRGELYIAHFLGPREATRFIKLASGRPDGNAAKYFPAAARANPSIFGGKAKPRTLAQVYGHLVAGHANAEFRGMAGDATGGRPWQVEVRPAAAFGQTFAFTAPSAGSSASKPGLGGIGVWGTIVQQTNDISGIGEAIATALHPGEIRPARSAPAERRQLVQRALQPAVPTRANAVRVTPSDLSFLDGGLFASPEKKS